MSVPGLGTTRVNRFPSPAYPGGAKTGPAVYFYGNPAADAFKACFQGEAGQREDARAKLLAEMLTRQLYLRLLKGTPEENRAAISRIQDDMRQSGQPGVIRESVVYGLELVKKRVDDPAVVEKQFRQVLQILMGGGYTKIASLLKLLEDPGFTKLPPHEQGIAVINAMGPVFVKAMQMAALFPDLFEPHVHQAIERAFENLPPDPAEEIHRLLLQELGVKSLDEKFQQFDPAPIKVGSIAQVHRATLLDGADVAVKIVKPSVLKTLENDLALLEPLVRLLSEYYPGLQMAEACTTLQRSILEESNMSQEAERWKILRAAFSSLDPQMTPEVFEAHSSAHILTMSFMPGDSLVTVRDNPDVARRYLEFLLTQIFQLGVFQGDQSLGNYLYDWNAQKLRCVDAGVVCTIDAEERLLLARYLLALASEDTNALIELMVPECEQEANPQELAACRLRAKALLQSGGFGVGQDWQQAGNLVKELARLVQTFGFTVVPLNPEALRALFSGLAVSRKLSSEVPLKRLLAKHLIKLSWRQSPRKTVEYGAKIVGHSARNALRQLKLRAKEKLV